MEFFAQSSGLASLWADVRTFLAGVRFDRPDLVWLCLVPVVLTVLEWFAARRDRARRSLIGRSPAYSRTHSPSRLTRFIRSLAWVSLVLGLAGPRWGVGEPEGVAIGRDVVLILDVSRSMLADDCEGGKSRWQAAVAGCQNLLDEWKTRGGHRVAVVVFAARPMLLVPLTTDFDHARAKLSEFNGRYPPADVRPDRDDFPSGTRIGAAIQFGIESLDDRFVNYRDAILLTDGDDPANDREWAVGVSAARKAGVPLHVVGLGDPDNVSLISLGNGLLEFADGAGVPDPVRTRLHEDVLQSIAAEGRGQYLPARRTMPALGPFARTAIEANPHRELTDDPLPTKRSRAAWFYAAGVAFLLLWWWREG
jgi:Ca-activated chloride channel family protein